MKKLTIAVGLLLGSITAIAQTEYVELTSNKFFKRSFACYYGDNNKLLDKDLECGELKGKLNYHWVEYTGIKEVKIICADKKYTYRKICINDKCGIYNTNNQVYTFTLTGVDSLKFYKPVFDQKHLSGVLLNTN